MSSGKPVAVSLRVSADDQSHESQRHEVLKWLTREGIDPERVEWYIDTGTGRNLDRKEFQRLESDIREGKRRTVVVYALDRLSRDFFDGVAILGRWLKSGVRVASVTEALDLSGELGQALAGVIFALAAAEWRKRKERQTAGIEVAKINGIYKGRKAGTKKADPARVAELRARGLGLAEIARATGTTIRTVSRYLKSTNTPPPN